MRLFNNDTPWFMNLKGDIKALGCGSLLWLPQEILSQECLFLVDILLSDIYNLIEEKGVPRYVYT